MENLEKRGETMSLFIVFTCVVKPAKQREFKQLIKRFLKYKTENPEKFKELRSWKLFAQTFGSLADAYIAMEEYDNMADLEKCVTRIFKDEGFMKIWQELMLLVEPETLSRNLWNAVT